MSARTLAGALAGRELLRLKPKLDLPPIQARRHEFVAAERDVALQPEAFAGLLKSGFQQCGKRPESALSAAPARVVELAAPELPEQAQHVLGAVGVVLAQPFDEQRRDLVRQPQQHVTRVAGAVR